ncbi:hypothetical protein OPV22_026278 [Ensete ventricosum]|uniref:Secreted protein n=1 Tax=Ensete ventricosum TaxID=4639 RepID=A0AAV8QJL6_ENSVE|nr:hypothetical protein OPV22_026278 [Ensete ventricosum]
MRRQSGALGVAAAAAAAPDFAGSSLLLPQATLPWSDRFPKGISVRGKGIQGTQTYCSANPPEFQSLDWSSHSASGRKASRGHDGEEK